MIFSLKTRKGRTKKVAGFTLVEVLLSVFFLGFSLVGLLLSFSQSNVLINVVKENEFATQGLREEMEKLRNSTWASLPSANGSFTASVNSGFTNLDSVALSRVVTDLAPVNNPNTMRQIRTQVSWTGFDGRSRIMNVSSIFTKMGINGQ